MHKVILTGTWGACTLKSTGSMVLAYLYSFAAYDIYSPPGTPYQVIFPPNAWEHFPTSASAHVVPFAFPTHSIPAHLSCQI